MVKVSSRGEFPSLWLIKDFGILGILWGKFLFHSLGGLGQSCRESELSNVWMVLPQHSAESDLVPLLSIDSSGKLGIVFFHSVEISQEISLFEYFWVIMSRNWGSPHPDRSSSPIDEGVRSG